MGVLEARANLDGKVAVVVGGAGGIGRAISLDLAASGAGVALCDIDPAVTESIRKELEDGGHRYLARVLDARDPDQLGAFYAEVDAAFDRLDIVVNVAGGVFQAPFMESGPEQWDLDIRTNYTYVLHSVHQAVGRMRRYGNGGSIVNFTTIEAHRAAPGFSVYAGAKAATRNFTRSLAVELAPEGIRINCVAPDLTLTENLMKSIPPLETLMDRPERAPELFAKGVPMQIPMGRVGAVTDASNAVLFLASDLSSYITGTTLHPDGGTHASSGWVHWPEGGFLPTPTPRTLERLFPAPD